MKFIQLLILLSLYGFNTNTTPTNKVKITVSNIKTVKGNIEIGIYNNPKSFPEKGKQHKVFTKKVTGKEMSFFINNLAEGEYAIAIYHDKNSDGKCNLNFLGIPKEAYGFSKNFKPIFSKPSFKDCKISIKNNPFIDIKLIN